MRTVGLATHDAPNDTSVTGPVLMRLVLVAPLVTRAAHRGGRSPGEPVPRLHQDANVAVNGLVRLPVLANVRHARLASVALPTSQRGPTWPERLIRSSSLFRYSRRERSPPARSRQRSPSGCWYSPPAHAEMPIPEEVSACRSRRNGRPWIKMIRSSEAAPILLSGARAIPTRTLQRLRARISARNRLTLSITPAGGLPASTCSKCCRASVSSPFRKNARASSSRTRTSAGFNNQHIVEYRDRLVEKGVAALALGPAGFLNCRDRPTEQRA